MSRFIVLISALLLFAAPAFAQSSIGIGAGHVPVCTYAELHAGTCQSEVVGYLATLSNGDGTSDPCDDGSGTGSTVATCRFDGTDWAVFGEGTGTDDQTAAEVSYTSTIAPTFAATVRAALDNLIGYATRRICATGLIRGGGYNATTEEYDWVCGNYNWSAEIGGIDGNSVADYDTPTTTGGNSWLMTCTGLGTGSPGTTQEQGACLAAGEVIRMYSTADLVLALDQTRPGGAVYMPEGIYHFGYCGQSSAGVANGCPVTREDPTVAVRKWTIYGGRRIIGEGWDPDGPYVNGRTGTWFVADMGTDNEGGNAFADDVTDWVKITGGINGDTWQGGHWAWHGGFKELNRICARPSGSTGCVTDPDVTLFPLKGAISQSPIAAGYTPGVVAAAFDKWLYTQSNQWAEICINDTIGSAGFGVCEDDMRVQCTANSGGRTGANTGDCSNVGDGLGACIGTYSAYKAQNAVDTANGDAGFLKVTTTGLNAYGTATQASETNQVFYAPIASDGFTDTACGGGSVGKLMTLGGPTTKENKYGFTNFPAITSTAASSLVIGTYVQGSVLDDYAEVSDLSVMNQDYFDNNNSANETGTCATGAENDCDELELINLSGGAGIRWTRIAAWYGAGSSTGHYGFSIVDGDPGCYFCELSYSLITHFRGLASDAAGFYFHDNRWEYGISTPTQVSGTIAAGFNPDARIERDVFKYIFNDNLFRFQNSSGLTIRDIVLESNEFGTGFFRFGGGKNITIDGVTGQANSGPIFTYAGKPTGFATQENIHVSNVRMKNHSLANNTYGFALWQRTDFGSQASFGTRYYGRNTFKDSSFQIHGDDDMCLFFFAGGTGDDSTTANGQSRDVDDDRNTFSFENVDLEVYSDGSKTGTQRAFCFGETHTFTGYPGGPGTSYEGSIKGPIPSWRNISINSVMIPDQPIASIRSEDAGDCGSLLSGTKVRVHDADVAGQCKDTNRDGIMDPTAADISGETSVCVCNPAGNGGTGEWRPENFNPITGMSSVVLDATTTIAVTDAGMQGQSYYLSNAGAKAVTLPACRAGLIAKFYDNSSDGGGVININPAGSEVIILDGTPGSAGASIDSGDVRGDFVTLECIDASTIVVTGRSGTWAAGS